MPVAEPHRQPNPASLYHCHLAASDCFSDLTNDPWIASEWLTITLTTAIGSKPANERVRSHYSHKHVNCTSTSMVAAPVGPTRNVLIFSHSIQSLTVIKSGNKQTNSKVSDTWKGDKNTFNAHLFGKWEATCLLTVGRKGKMKACVKMFGPLSETLLSHVVCI